MLIGATESAALETLDCIKTELEVNERLAEDFPEVCYPVAQLEGIANRCAGQLYKGERTRITWTSNEIVLPTVEGSRASGIIVRVAGITGRIRGMKFKRSDGRNVRPSHLSSSTIRRPRNPPDRWNRHASGFVCLPETSWDLPVPGRKSPGSCPARSSARVTWPTSSSTETHIRTGTAKRPEWSTASPQI